MNEKQVRDIAREEIEKATAEATVNVVKEIEKLLTVKLTKVPVSEPEPGSKTIKGVSVIGGYAVTHDKAQ
ncbi:hypothetical protein [Paenibacillus senegalensis]|uniref:hypothetical protein n=1 Tax=Paenibacillus senegalensis TaxID=1465766 RepID=UPI000287D586|nr:hypothetical protein [Paenibacillus senegalensis]